MRRLTQRLRVPSIVWYLWNKIRANALIATLAALATIIAAGFAAASYFHQVDADEREGKLGGQLLLSVGDNGPLNAAAPTYFFFSMPKDGEGARYLVPIRFKLLNTANVHDNRVNLSIEYERINNRRLIPKEVIKFNGKRPAQELSYEISSGDKYDVVKYSIAFLSPHDSQSFSDGAFATRMAYDPKAPLLFNSGTGLDMIVETYSERDIPRQWNIRYRGLTVPDNAGIQQVMKNWYIPQLAFEIRRDTGFWAYIPKLLLKKEVIIYGYSPDFRFIPDMNTFIPQKMPDAFGLRVKPYSWRLLFDFLS